MKLTIQKLVKLAFLFSIFFTLFSAQAQAPQKMSYQAVVRNAANTLIANTAVGVKISVLQTTATGITVYSERHTPTTNANGLASFEIGGGTVLSGTFANINWANGPYFIKTETDPVGGTNYTIAGTSQLASVPYALFAANGGTPGPQGIQGVPGATGAPGIAGTAGAAGAVGKNSVALTTVEPAGANCATGGSRLQFGIDANSNNVLDISEINASLTRYVCNGAQGTTGATGAQGIVGTAGAAGAVGKNSVALTSVEPAGANCATGGNKLQFGIDANSNNVLDISEINASLTRYVCNGAQGTTGATGAQGPAGTATNAWGLTGTTGTTAANFIGTTDATKLKVKTNNVQAMQIDSDGVVGITSDVPGAPITGRFYVNGNSSMYGSPVTNIDSFGTFTVNSKDQSGNDIDPSMTFDGETIQTKGYDQAGGYALPLKINPLGGNVAFGANIGVNSTETNLQNKVQIGNSPGFSGNDIAIGNGAQAMSLYQGPTASTFFTNTNFAFMPASGIGNVGIGTTAPQEKLEVVGNAKVSGDSNVGGNLNVTGNIQVNGGPDNGIYSFGTGSFNLVPLGIFRFDLSSNVLNQIEGSVYNDVGSIITSSNSYLEIGIDDTITYRFFLNPALTSGYSSIIAVGNPGFDSPNYVRAAKLTYNNTYIDLKYIIDSIVGFRFYSFGTVMVYGVK
jgi:hypothetical protein